MTEMFPYIHSIYIKMSSIELNATRDLLMHSICINNIQISTTVFLVVVLHCDVFTSLSSGFEGFQHEVTWSIIFAVTVCCSLS